MLHRHIAPDTDHVHHSGTFNGTGGLAPPDVGNEEIEAANPWGMLLRTFLPWVNAGQVPDYVNQQEEEEAVHDQEAEGTEHDGAIPEEDDLD